MKRTRLATLVIIAAVVLTAGIVQSRRTTALYRGIPVEIRQRITEDYAKIGATDIVWRVHHVQDDTGLIPPGERAEFVVLEWRDPKLPEFYRFLDMYRITRSGDDLRFQRWSINASTVLWNANFAYTLTDNPDPAKQRPYEHFAYGVAVETRIARIRAITEDGRVTETVPFDGYWWMTAKMDPANYALDRWENVLFLDAQGNVVDTEERCTIYYPRLPCESYQPPR